MVKTIDFVDVTDEVKAQLRDLRAAFVMAPREMSDKRLVGIIKDVLARGNVIFGVASEAFVDGFDGQPQFRTLPLEPVEALVRKIEATNLPHRLQVVRYAQADVDDVIRAVRPARVVVVQGSYLYPFHRSATCALLEKRGIPFEYVSSFVDEAEAKQFLAQVEPLLPRATNLTHTTGDETRMFAAVATIATCSFDYGFQTGAVLAEQTGKTYRVIDAACNEVVPYQTYALHFGHSREIHQAAHQSDAVHYDTIHAEMNLLVRAMKNGTKLTGKSLFINMMPCPNCARTLVETGLEELVYHEVHSDGYAVDLFEKAGIKTRRVAK